MKYSTATNYALHTVLLLAKEAGHGKNIGVQQLAERQQLSPTYLSKILTKLSKEGLIISSSGANGGYSLRSGWESISFLDIIHAIEGKSSLFECCLHSDQQCDIKRVMLQAEQKMENELQKQTIAELIHSI